MKVEGHGRFVRQAGASLSEGGWWEPMTCWSPRLEGLGGANLSPGTHRESAAQTPYPRDFRSSSKSASIDVSAASSADTELDALLASLDEQTAPASQPETAAETTMDADLDELLKSLG